MTAFTRLPSKDWRDHFLLLLPKIQSYASHAFRHLDAESKSNAVSDVVANAWVAFDRLSKLGKIGVAYPTVLARYGVAQFNEGRRVGTSTNTRDVTSPAAKRKHRHQVDSISRNGDENESWKSIVVEDRSAGPAEIAQVRIDFDAWLTSLTEKQQRVANLLCGGGSTSELSEDLGVSCGRVSQFRRELEQKWNQFTAENLDAEVPVAS